MKLKLFLIAVFFSFPARFLGADTYSGPDTCAPCHSDIYSSWKGSLHARAYSSETFQKVWKSLQKKSSCLACHTTGSKSGSLHFEHPGVTCESCHGAFHDGHPAESKMPIPVSSEMCKSCHKKTYQEWKTSVHGQKNIRCFDCHLVHSQGLRAGGEEELCGRCHSKRLNDFAHSTHHLEGLKCVTCHMPRTGDKANTIEGTGAAGHTFSVGAEVCSRCHEEMVHKGSSLPTLRTKVTEFEQQMSVAGVQSVFDLNEKVKDLEWRQARLRQSVWVTALLAFLIGLLLGWLGLWILMRRNSSK